MKIMTMMVILSSSTKILLTESWMEAAEGVFLFHAISNLWTVMMDGYVEYADDHYHCGDNDHEEDDR